MQGSDTEYRYSIKSCLCVLYKLYMMYNAKTGGRWLVGFCLRHIPTVKLISLRYSAVMSPHALPTSSVVLFAVRYRFGLGMLGPGAGLVVGFTGNARRWATSRVEQSTLSKVPGTPHHSSAKSCGRSTIAIFCIGVDFNADVPDHDPHAPVPVWRNPTVKALLKGRF
jgi:hypothetical protein